MTTGMAFSKVTEIFELVVEFCSHSYFLTNASNMAYPPIEPRQINVSALIAFYVAIVLVIILSQGQLSPKTCGFDFYFF